MRDPRIDVRHVSIAWQERGANFPASLAGFIHNSRANGAVEYFNAGHGRFHKFRASGCQIRRKESRLIPRHYLLAGRCSVIASRGGFTSSPSEGALLNSTNGVLLSKYKDLTSRAFIFVAFILIASFLRGSERHVPMLHYPSSSVLKRIASLGSRKLFKVYNFTNCRLAETHFVLTIKWTSTQFDSRVTHYNNCYTVAKFGGGPRPTYCDVSHVKLLKWNSEILF